MTDYFENKKDEQCRMDLRMILIVAVFISPSRLKGSSAVTPVFVQKGDDLLLNVTEADIPEKFNIFYWQFNSKGIVKFSNENKNTKVFNDYTGRVEFSEENLSVTLKNLQEADSGVYAAQVMGDKEKPLSEYNVTVQAPVSPVGLTVDSVSNSSDSCDLTVTCRTQDSHINSTDSSQPNTSIYVVVGVIPVALVVVVLAVILYCRRQKGKNNHGITFMDGPVKDKVGSIFRICARIFSPLQRNGSYNPTSVSDV